MEDQGEKGTTTLAARVDVEIKSGVEERARVLGVPMSSVVRWALQEWLERNAKAAEVGSLRVPDERRAR